MKENVTSKLVDFVTQAEFKDLPKSVIHEAKRVLLDSVACALGGITTDKGRLGVAWARMLGGPPEATVLGTGDRLSCVSAAFANGELMNALDYDAILVGSHITPFVIPAVLALAEKSSSSGKELILAMAIGHEISARISLATTWLMELIKEGLEKGLVTFPEVYGYSKSVFGGVAGASKILRLNKEKTGQAFGIVGSIAPMNAMPKWFDSPPAALTKYLMAGWVAQGEITAALLAHEGYTGISDILDGQDGFWKYSGSQRWEPEKVTAGLGQKWYFAKVDYKPYPCCKAMHTGLDCLLGIMETEVLQAEDIETVQVWLTPQARLPLWQNQEIMTHVDGQFSMPYVFAVAAHRIPSVHWQEWPTMRDPKILGFMKRINCLSHPDFGPRMLADSRERLAKVEVVTKDGRRFTEERKYPRGSHFRKELRMTDRELESKFRERTSSFLTLAQIDRALEAIFEMEQIKDISELMGLVSMKR